MPTVHGVLLLGTQPISAQLVTWRTSADELFSEISAALPGWPAPVYTTVVLHGRRRRAAPRRWLLHDVDLVALRMPSGGSTTGRGCSTSSTWPRWPTR